MLTEWLYLVNQQWIIEYECGKPNVFRIASKEAPALYITTPSNPCDKSLLTVEAKMSDCDGKHLIN